MLPSSNRERAKHASRKSLALKRRTTVVVGAVTSALTAVAIPLLLIHPTHAADAATGNTRNFSAWTAAATAPRRSLVHSTRSLTNPAPTTTSVTTTAKATSAAPTTTAPAPSPTVQVVSSQPPARGGYFSLQPVGASSTLPSDGACASQVHRSSWEPRPDNTAANHSLVDANAVHQSFAARPVSTGGSNDPRWDSWLLQRVDGQFTGTTDEIFQWAACKWGLPDDVLRAIAVRESTWYQYETYSSERPVVDWGSGDMMTAGTAGAGVFCNMLAQYGHNYQADFGTAICPKTFSIAGVMSWQAPSWGQMPGNQNGTFPFNRQSTAFALDYLASQLRGCYNGWEFWLSGSGNYAAGDLWGCVGAWYAGDWHSTDADGYISRVKNELANFTWLQADWPSIKPSCSATYGCPVAGRY